MSISPMSIPSMNIKIAIVIPVYNHGKTLREVVTRCLAVCESLPVGTKKIATHETGNEQGFSAHDILVVDDGSDDKGMESIQDYPIQKIYHEVNKGKGAALLTAARALKAQGYSHMIALDADAQHYPEDIPSFTQAIMQNSHGFIVGKRDFSVANIPASSRFGRKFSKFWMFVQTGYSISDMQSGFRAYNLDALLCLDLKEPRYSFEIEVLVKAAWAGFAIEEIPIKVYYQKGPERISHFNKIKDNVRISILNTRLTIRALIPIPFRRHVLDVEGANVSLLSPLKSLHILLQQSSPVHLATSSAIAFFICSLPLLGLQSILLLLCINTWHLNRLCALVVIPLSWPPFLPALCILVGYRVWNGEWLTQFSMETLYYQIWHRFVDWIVGSLVLAPLLGILMGIIVYIMSCILNKYYLRARYEMDK